MKDERVREALDALPREEARSGFTAGVLARIDRQPRRSFPNRWAPIVATAAILLLGLGLGWREWQSYLEQQEARARFTQLLAEKQALEAELRSLRRLTEEAQPVVYLGGNENVDLVLDLARLQRRGGLRTDAGGLARARPADFPSRRFPTTRSSSHRQQPVRQASPRRVVY